MSMPLGFCLVYLGSINHACVSLYSCPLACDTDTVHARRIQPVAVFLHDSMEISMFITRYGSNDVHNTFRRELTYPKLNLFLGLHATPCLSWGSNPSLTTGKMGKSDLSCWSRGLV